MEKKRYRAVKSFTLKYDVTSPEFIAAFAAYKNTIYSKATIYDMLIHIAHHVAARGTQSFIEGVGYVSVDGCVPIFCADEFCGVDVDSDYNDVTVEQTT